MEAVGGKTFEWKTQTGKTLAEGEDYTIINGVTTFLKEQTDNVFCKITNPDFPSMALQTTSTKITNEGQSLEASTLENEVNAYSNTTAELTIVAPVDAKYTVYNLSGKAVAQGNILKSEETINTPSGIYLVKIEVNKGVITKKVVVN